MHQSKSESISIFLAPLKRCCIAILESLVLLLKLVLIEDVLAELLIDDSIEDGSVIKLLRSSQGIKDLLEDRASLIALTL